jgi:3'-phosphoadenosine 5'-phosphosulfate sulfotransferase (PAPS reductase)/FAD synthetase
MGLSGPKTGHVMKEQRPGRAGRFRRLLESSNRSGILFTGTRRDDAFLKKAERKNDSPAFSCQKQFYNQF